jgi:hypothetical protein
MEKISVNQQNVVSIKEEWARVKVFFNYLNKKFERT